MHVLHVITGLGAGGAEAMLVKLVSAPGQCRHSIVSLAGRGELSKQIEDLHIDFTPLELRDPLGVMRALAGVVHAIEAGKPDVIVAWLPHGVLLTTLALRLARIRVPLIWNVRQSLGEMAAEKWTTKLLFKLNAYLSGAPRAIIYNSSAGAHDHERIGFDETRRVIIPNGFDLTQYYPSDTERQATRATLGIATDEVVFGLIARVHWMKNHAGFFEAASRVLDTFPKARFLLAGFGADRDNRDLKSAIGDHRLYESSLFLGQRSDIPSLTRALDVATNVSLTEGFANTIGEAMACGVPCLVTDTGDSAAIVGDTGIVSKRSDGASIARGMLDFIERGPERRKIMGEAARARATEHFSISGIVRQYEEVFQMVVERDRSLPA